MLPGEIAFTQIDLSMYFKDTGQESIQILVLFQEKIWKCKTLKNFKKEQNR